MALKKKCAFKLLRFMCFSFFCNFCKNWFYLKCEPHLENGFSGTLFCYFGKAPKCIKTGLNCIWNCVTPLFTSLEVQFSIIFFLQKRTPSSSEMQSLFQRLHLKDIDEKNHGFEKLGAYKSQFCKKIVGALHFRENW